MMAGVKDANWLFGGVDQRLSYTTAWYLITPENEWLF
jgi:hypothetical protein